MEHKEYMLFIGSDHAGYVIKERIKKYLEEKGVEYTDCGTNSEDSVDYPDYAQKVGESVAKNNAQGILVCGSGIGICIAANKIKGVRAAHCISSQYAKLARMHNDANILCLPGREEVVSPVEEIIDSFLQTDFEGNKEEGARHKRRVEKINSLD